MASYKVEIDKNVRKKDLPSIPKAEALKIVRRIESLSDNPFPEGAIRLKGREEWRIRQGDYRILYVVKREIITVFVIKVGHRREIYRK
jgi:mRNA interferase RelE/StbE